MSKIGGNISAQIQKNSGSTKNAIGERSKTWTTLHTVSGFLDLSSGDSKYSTYDAKIQESTHVFVCDYFFLDSSITAENSRLMIDGKTYDVMLIDDPMELHKHLEFYLKYTGGQNG
jgi:head-tail adaptor